MKGALWMILISPFTALLPAIYGSFAWFSQKRKPGWFQKEWGLLLLFPISLIAAAGSKSLPSFLGSLGLLVLIGFYLYLSETFTEEKNLDDLLRPIWPMGIATGLFGALEKILSLQWDITWFGRLFWSPNYIPNPNNYRVYATFGNPNVTGMWFAWFFLLALYLWETKTEKRGGYLAGAALFGILLVFTGSRGATLGLLAALVIYAFVTKNRTVRITVFTAMFAMGAFAYFSPQINHAIHSSRLDWWMKSLEYILQRPVFGWGLWGAMENIGNIHSHNAWVSIVFFFGGAGFLSYCFWKIPLLIRLWKKVRQGSEPAMLLIASHGLLLVHGLVDFTWMTPQGGILFFGLCGITAGLCRKNENPKDKEAKI